MPFVFVYVYEYIHIYKITHSPSVQGLELCTQSRRSCINKRQTQQLFTSIKILVKVAYTVKNVLFCYISVAYINSNIKFKCDVA